MRPQSHLSLYISLVSINKGGLRWRKQAMGKKLLGTGRDSWGLSPSYRAKTEGMQRVFQGDIKWAGRPCRCHRTPSERDSAPLPFRARAHALQPHPSEKRQPHSDDHNHEAQVTPVFRPPHRRIKPALPAQEMPRRITDFEVIQDDTELHNFPDA